MRLASSAVVVLALLWPINAQAVEGSFQLGDAYVKTSGTKANVIIAAQWDRDPAVDEGSVFNLFLKAPIGDVSDDTFTFRIAELSSRWRLGFGYRYDWLKGTGVNDDNQGHNAVGLVLEWGYNQFAWNPNGGSETDRVWENSGTAKIFWTGYYKRTKSRAWAWDISARYAHEYEDSKEVGVVMQVTTTGLNISTDLRIAPPKVIPSATARLYFFVDDIANLGTNAAIGPTLSYTSFGDGSDAEPNGGNRIGRLELWAYWFPVSEQANLRIGAAPYVDYYFKGKAEDGRTAIVGGLFQLKTGIPYVY